MGLCGFIRLLLFFDIRLICSTFAAVPMDDAVGTFFL